MAAITLNTTRQYKPTIYAYTAPGHDGWIKIGYTEGDVDKRIRQQTHTAWVDPNKVWSGNAVYEDGSFDTFSDHDFHAYLRKCGIEQKKGTEWFRISVANSQKMFEQFKRKRGFLEPGSAHPYTLRREQQEAVSKALDYFRLHEEGEFLWNAKPRFGKTLSVYELCKQLGAESVLILSNRPAIANSWLDDYNKFLGKESGYLFVSDTNALKNKPGVYTQEAYNLMKRDNHRVIVFVSNQNLKGSVFFGGTFDKLKEYQEKTWDLLVIDEAHEGVDTQKAKIAYSQIKRKNTLHLSGTPFKALANEKFKADAIFNWTYADEQRAKAEWDEDVKGEKSPYEDLPRLNLYTYQMSEIVHDEVVQGMQIDDGKSVDYAFDLNEFFSVKKAKIIDSDGKVNVQYYFNHEDAVDKFLDALTKQEKFPFSTDELRDELKHTMWLLESVDSANALYRKLSEHEVFKDYEIVLAVGDRQQNGKIIKGNSLDLVRQAIDNHDKTITLSVGQLTTGVTIHEWSGVLMLSNVESPSFYIQAAFRAQTPWLFSKKGQNGSIKLLRKENAYIFDFDPARTLTIFKEFATKLNPDSKYNRQQQVRELLNFFPVIGEDENGKMIALDAEKVLTIPNKLKSQEVVNRRFMCNNLFQNISNIFHAPQAILEILNKIPKAKNSKGLDTNGYENIHINEDGDVTIPKEQVIGTAQNIFGKKIYKDHGPKIAEIIKELPPKPKTDEIKQIGEKLKTYFHDNVTKPNIEEARKNSETIVKKTTQSKVENRINNGFDAEINRIISKHSIEQETLKAEETKAIESAKSEKDAKCLVENFRQKRDDNIQKLIDDVVDIIQKKEDDAQLEISEAIEKQEVEDEKNSKEDDIRDHLRSFSRTIPSFLMAYGNGDNITLMNLDTVIPANVFKDVTSITLEEFRALRDGGDFTNAETGETEHFDGHLFDQEVFDDSVKIFMEKKKQLANYFNEENKEDIFDYIPPQRNNQVFTPKFIVKKMVDLLEQENPGCFDDPDKTFIDLYMKSGLFITEIVKRLYNSSKIKAAYPDSKERLHHIFEKQVYGLAPTEIIYKIAESYILGFDEKSHTIKHNLRQADALPYAKKGELDQLLDRLYK